MGPERELTELESDLRATAEGIEADAEHLQAIERQKAALRGDDPNVLELAKDAQAVAEEIEAKASIETALAKEESERREA